MKLKTALPDSEELEGWKVSKNGGRKNRRGKEDQQVEYWKKGL